tara:strand:- start:463 stop:1329 length:867 start_codon:yes stop_codon:yes gene_type:complete
MKAGAFIILGGVLGVFQAIQAADTPVDGINKKPEVVPSFTSPGIGADKNATKKVETPLPALPDLPRVIGQANAPAKPANLGKFEVIPNKNPFGLIKPQGAQGAKPDIVQPKTIGVPVLIGISHLRNNVRAVLRISAPGSGAAETKRLKAGEMANGVEVLKIDSAKGIVEVKVAGKTFPLEYTGARSSKRPVGAKPLGRPTSTPSAPKPKSTKPEDNGSLQPVPQRPLAEFLDKVRTILPEEPSLYERPAFNAKVQRTVVDPLDIRSQRDIVRGQYSPQPPTDIPVDRR